MLLHKVTAHETTRDHRIIRHTKSKRLETVRHVYTKHSRVRPHDVEANDSTDLSKTREDKRRVAFGGSYA